MKTVLIYNFSLALVVAVKANEFSLVISKNNPETFSSRINAVTSSDTIRNVFNWMKTSTCCKRHEAFRVNCDSGCIREDVIKSEPFSKSKQSNYSFLRWMTELPDELKLSEMSIPGTHDTGAIEVALSIWTQTQSMPLRTQLDAGVRLLDVRCHHVNNMFKIHHGIIPTNLNFDDVLKDVTKFLTENPGEVVLMRIKEENADFNKNTNKRSFAETLKKQYIENHSDFFWMNTTVPKLGQARGKILILDNTPGSPGFGPAWTSFKIQDDYMLPGDISETVQAQTNWKWKRAEKFFEETNSGDLDTVYVNFLSGISLQTPPHLLAKGPQNTDGMNERARRYLSPENEKIIRAGWIFADFPGPSLIYSILIHN